MPTYDGRIIDSVNKVGRVIRTRITATSLDDAEAVIRATPGTSQYVATDKVESRETPAEELVPGTIADAMVAAGATGSLSAKLRRLSQDLSDFKALVPTALTGLGNFKVSIEESPALTASITGTVDVNVINSTVAISASALPLPTGASTAANQSTTNSTLSTINTKLVTAKTEDFDTGAGTDTVQMLGIALPANGGAVIGGTQTNPIKIDPANLTPMAIGNLDGESIAFGGGNRLKVGQETLLFFDPIEGAAVNVNLWTTTFTTMTSSQASGILTLNAASSTSVTAFILLNTVKSPVLLSEFPLHFHARIKVIPQANSVIEIGMFLASGITAPTDGVFLRWDNAGVLKGVINYGGTETLTSALTALGTSEYYELIIIINLNKVRFTVINTAGTAVIETTLDIPTGQASIVSVSHLPGALRVYNTAIAPSAAPQLFLSALNIQQMDNATYKRWDLQLVENGRHASQNISGTFVQTAQWANSAAPANATLSNTTPGYTTLGGLYAFAAVLGAATDYVLFAFQVPIGFQLVIRGIDIDCVVTGADMGGSATVMFWGVGINSSGASLATADNNAVSPNTYAPRRLGIGTMGFLQTENRGAVRQISKYFDTPIVVEGGRYIQIIVRIPVATATVLQVFQGLVTINGCFE